MASTCHETMQAPVEAGFLSGPLGSGRRLLGRGRGLEPAVSLYIDRDFEESRM